MQLLDGHPWFNLDVVAASDKSTGKKYKDAVTWGQIEKMPDDIAKMMVDSIEPDILKSHGIDLVFSALPADAASEIESNFASNGFKVFSNASSNRMVENVPLLIADINPEHIAMIDQQTKGDKDKGYIVTNPNCTVVGLATCLKPLVDNFGIKAVTVSTYQALSGAGYPGVPSSDILGNVLPYIPGEEEKVEEECRKILGKVTIHGLEHLSLEVCASCARVPVRDGHLEAVVVELFEEPTVEGVVKAFSDYPGLKEKGIELPSAPDKPIIITHEENRPQPLLDIYSGTPQRAKGMAVVIGRIKLVKNKLRIFLLVHNTIRGAAGCSIMNAELARVKGYL